MTPPHKWYRPVFSGTTETGERIILYMHELDDKQIHILRPDGEMWALSPGSEVEMRVNSVTDTIYIHIVSPEWTGGASGSMRELIEAGIR